MLRRQKIQDLVLGVDSEEDFFVIGEIYSSSGCSSLLFCLCPRLFFTTSLSNLPSLCILRTEGFIAGLISKGVKGAWKAELLPPC